MGVKSLWSLLDPVGRPVLLETMEGKAMAIDSSIWIYQFQATMRDKEGRGLVNAHVLGFLRRICKLLFYGIKPVFVFDGGAPALKRATIADRKSKKSGAALSHAKLAERLLAAQLRREALNQVQAKTGGSARKGKAPEGPVVIDDSTVYLEDIDDSVTKTPSKKAQKGGTEPSPPSSKKKSRWHDHDPYKLPEVNLDEAIAKATRATAPDPRLATEDELRAFIEEMRPEDFDVTSPEFRELPTEVQYEIIGDLRLKSRQTSYKRLQNMLRIAKTPLDFSKEQIKNLKHRNALTQQLLVTTDSIGKAHVSIPIRIASERNREYVLIKNEGGDGGWVLGIRDEGTRSKPIEIDHTSDKEKEDGNTDDEMEEVAITDNSAFDPDLRELRRGQALSALANRYSPKKLAPLNTKTQRKPKNSRPLFAPDEEEVTYVASGENQDDDPELALAIQESLEHQEESHLRQALEASKSQLAGPSSEYNAGASTSRTMLDDIRPSTPESGPYDAFTYDSGTPSRRVAGQDSDDDDLYATPMRLETALSIANAGSARRSFTQTRRVSSNPSSMFGIPTLLLPTPPVVHTTAETYQVLSDSDEEMEEVSVLPTPNLSLPDRQGATNDDPSFEETSHLSTLSPKSAAKSDSDEEMEEITPLVSSASVSQTPIEPSANYQSRSPPPTIPPTAMLTTAKREEQDLPVKTPPDFAADLNLDAESGTSYVEPTSPAVLALSPVEASSSVARRKDRDDAENEPSSDSEDEDLWAQTSFPIGDDSRTTTVPVESTADGWDAAEEMDPQAEEGEFARFLSQVKGRDINTVRREIDDEIRDLHQQKKVAMRDSEDITQQMISQIMIMLRLFGIPYITAPMEAEAQCAELLSIGLVDGIITDDSDVFLFGGLRVLKNMFNQSKTVECFLLSDLEREVGLDRDKLIRLAYLLGSDYTEGLPGVGPVVAMELLKEFPGQDGLHKFKHWWQKVQSGKDAAEDTNSSFRKRFKKRFKELYLPDDWPNPAVRDAYYHPTVDESEEPFKWGLPDLDALRDFFNSELGWHQSKVDDLLLPIIRKMGKRGQSSALNKQGNLMGFFDVPIGANHAPRKRQAYASKRLQQVVSDFRKEQARLQSSESATTSTADEDGVSDAESEVIEKPVKRRRTTAGKGKGQERAAPGSKKANTSRSGKSARGGKAKRQPRKRKASSASEDVELDNVPSQAGSPPPPLAVNLRPQPKPAYRGSKASTNISDEEEVA